MTSYLKPGALALSLVMLVAARDATGPQLTLQPASKVWFDGNSTIKKFSCTANEVNAAVQATDPNAVAQLLAGTKSVGDVDVTIPVEKLDCGNGTMNEHMRKAINLSAHPQIAFHLNKYEMARAGEVVNGTLTGTLALGGQSKPIVVKAEGRNDAGVLHVVGSYDLKMTDYDVVPPKLMFGRIKVAESVTVRFDLLLKR
ncbi:MAG: YceI family protein [Gemmatimonadetes bacterium]|nr:YceI family protein [Gemmatimonadota bacterium]